MAEENKIIWPEGSAEVESVQDFEWLMAGKTGQPLRKIHKDKYKNYLSITGIEMKPVATGSLPVGPSGQERKMIIQSAGVWTYGGNNFVNPVGEIMTLWWNGTTWSVADRAVLPIGKDGRDITEWESKAYAFSSSAPKVSFLVFRDSKIWENNAATLSTDIPGISPKWTLKTGISESDIVNIQTKYKVMLEIYGSTKLKDDFNTDIGWTPHPSYPITPVISGGVMTLRFLSGQNQFVQLPLTNSKANLPIRFLIRCRYIGPDVGQKLIFGFSLGSASDNPLWKIFTPTDTFQDFSFYNTANSSTKDYVYLGSNIPINKGAVIEVDFIQIGIDGLVETPYYPLKDIFSNIPMLQDLQSAVSKGGNVYLEPITYTINIPLVIPNYTNIIGVKGKTIIKYTGSGSFIDLNASKGAINGITLKDFSIDGGEPIGASTLTPEQIKNKTGIGPRNAIVLTGTNYNIEISGLRIYKFSGVGIKSSWTHNRYTDTCKIFNNVVTNCWIGMLQDTRSEYQQFFGNSFCYNQIGAWIEGGNNLGTLNHYNANCAGVVVSGLGRENDTHGSISTSTINHNLRYSVFAINVNNGFSFTGCYMIGGDIYFENSRGISIRGGQIGGNIKVVSELGAGIISNTIFTKGFTVDQNTKVAMFGNRFIDGSLNFSINNSN
ncbi:hypothetical protein [Sphingobacterium faecium]|uniref:hypothetical protein n=1 Tax=Sphingobacterium faecium TaxID=34087 RepID=UPI003207DCB3